MRCGSLVELDTLNLEENEIEADGLSELARRLNRGLAKLDAGFLYSRGNPGAKCKLTMQALVDACRRGGELLLLKAHVLTPIHFHMPPPVPVPYILLNSFLELLLVFPRVIPLSIPLAIRMTPSHEYVSHPH